MEIVQRYLHCVKCTKTFADKKGLWLHVDDKHPEVRNPQILLCNHCGKTFTVKIKLNQHVQMYHELSIKEKIIIQCKHCEFNVSNTTRFKVHMRKHTGEKPEICQHCGIGFSEKNTLKNHESLHTGEKPFKCKICPSEFAQRGGLKSHVRAHHKEETLAKF